MAELFADPSFWKNNGQKPAGNYTGNPEIDRELELMPEDERQAALAEIMAPPTGEEVAQMIQSKLAVGEVANVTREEYRLYKAYQKTVETDIMESIGMGADMVWNDMQKAAGSIADKPFDSIIKLGPTFVEAFSQGTRGLYGMLAESQDPNSALFRVKNAIFVGGDEDAEYEQFMQALDFNAKSTRLMQGKETLVVDKDLINQEVTQAMSYVADPSLFIPFGGIALKGARLIGMGEGIAKAAARASAIKQMVIGGTLKWGVGAPIEVVGGATRATIDAAVDRGSRAISAVTGMQPAEIATTARMTGLGTIAAEAAGVSVPFGTGIAETYVGASTLRGVGEAIGAVGEQMMRGERGILSYAQKALRESAEGGAKLTPQAENLLKAIDFFDPMFSYTADITKGVTQGSVIGGGLGYLSGGEEGMAQGIGAGAVLGGVGAGFGRIYADISGATKVDRMRITTDLGLNILAETNPTVAKDYATLRAVAQVKGVNIDGYISGLLRIAPDLDTYFKGGVDHKAEIKARGFDPDTYDGSFVDQNGRRLFSMAEFEKAEGFVIDKAKDGRVTLGINLDNLKKNTVPHEAFHTIFRSVVMEPEFQKRMTESVLGAFDKDGKQISAPKVSQAEAVAFFDRYLKALHKGDKLNEQRALLKQALEEYYRDGQTKVMADDGKTPFLANLSEEFGAYYFTQFIEGKPLDYLFLGGELGGVRGIMQSVQDGWLDYWEGRAKRVEPKFDMNNPDGIDYAFKPKGGKRVRVGAIDYLMQDLVRAASQRRQDGSINLSRMSRDTREQFLRSQGLDGVGETRQKPWRPKSTGGQDTVKIYNKTFGPQVHAAILAMPENLRPKVDGNGDFVGPLSKEVIEQMVSTGHVSREMANKIQVLQDMANGKMQSNIAEMGYVGWSMQTDVGPNPPRVYGGEVPYKRRKVMVLGVESKIGPKGMSFTAKTLDWQVIETRANNLWSDTRVRNMWGDDRGAFVQDFFRYLSNASKTDAEGRVPSGKLWAENGDAKRDIMQQMAGIPRNVGETYAHPPIAEIHEDILNSVMNLTVNRMSDVRVTGDNVFFDAEKAAPFIRVNMKVADMPYEETPNGKVFTDKQSGFRFTQTAKGVTAFDKHGEFIGSYANLEDAGKFAKRVYERQQAAMKEVAMQVTDEASRGITYKSKKQFVADRISVTKDEAVKSQLINGLQRYIEAPQWSEQTKQVAARNIEEIKNGIFSEEMLNAGWNIQVEYNGKKLDLAEHIKAEEAPANSAWEAMFPRTFRSRLLDKVQKLQEQNPNLSYQGLIKKLLRDSSNGYRFYAEAEAIGLLDFLRSKINPAQRIEKQRDAQGNWTGGIKTTDKPFADSKIRGGRTDVPIDIEEISNWIYNKELTLQVDDGARANISDTSSIVQEGTTLGYNETAIRMPQEYAHGISGHYGPDVVVHHRSTVRKDVNGEQVRFVDEIQANNAKERKTNKLAPDEVKKLEENKKIYEKLIDDGLKTGAFVANAVEGGAGPWSSVSRALSDFNIVAGNIDAVFGGKILNDPIWNNYGEVRIKLDYGQEDVITISPEAMADTSQPRQRLNVIRANMLSLADDMRGLLGNFGQTNNPVANAERLIKLIEAEDIRKIRTDFGTFFIEPHVKIPEIKNKILDILKAYASQERLFEKYKFVVGRSSIDYPQGIRTALTDIETKLQQHRLATDKLPPLTEISEWSAVAIKDIITKSIQDGIDLITITHPDDSPVKSNMAPDARHADYGRIFPQVAQKIVGKYGIEVRQRNELPALTEAQMATDKAYRDASEARNKAQADAMEVFNKTQGQGESPDVISELARQFSRTPENLINEFTDFGIGVGWFEDKIMPLLSQVKSEELRNKLTDVAQRITQEAAVFNGVKESIYSQYDPSVVAIDRGMSFRLNKEIKEAVMQGELRTAYKPLEEYQGGDDYYKPKKNRFESKDEQGFLIRHYYDEKELSDGHIVRNPEALDWMDIGHGNNDKTASMWYIDDATGNIKKGKVSEYATHQDWFNDLDKQGSVRGRIEFSGHMDRYGKVIERPRLSIMNKSAYDFYSGKEYSTEFTRKSLVELKKKIAKSYGLKPEDVDAYYFGGDKDVKTSFGFSPKDQLPIKFKPSEAGEEGGRTYTPKQMERQFIGRVAAENPEKIKGLKVEYGIVQGRMGEEAVVLMKDGKNIGRISWMTDKEYPDRPANDISVEIEPAYRGRGLQDVLYSEAYERMRANGTTMTRQDVYNKQGLPVRSQIKILGKNASTFETTQGEKKLTYNAFMRELNRALASGEEFVSTEGVLDPQAWYKPEEGDLPRYTEADTNRINSKVNAILSELGVKLQDKTIVEIWKRGLQDDPETALDVINSEGVAGWMKSRAESFLEFDADMEGDVDARQLKYQQRQAQKFLDAIENKPLREGFKPEEGDAPNKRTFEDAFDDPAFKRFAGKTEVIFPSSDAATYIERFGMDNSEMQSGSILTFKKGVTFFAYHGSTSKERFTTLRTDLSAGDSYWARKGSKDSALGTHYTNDEILAKNFTLREISKDGDSFEWRKEKDAGQLYAVAVRMDNPIYYDHEAVMRSEIRTSGGAEALKERLKKQGHDGIIYRIEAEVRDQQKKMDGKWSLQDAPDFADHFLDEDVFGYIPFNEKNVKDVQHNVGTFDRTKSNINLKPLEGDAPLRVNFSPDEVKKNLRSLQSAIDRQSDKDKVPAGIKKGVGRLIQAVERQRKEDVKTMPQAVKEGFKALADAVDAQADMDKVPAGVRKGLRLLFEAAQYEDLKPQQAMPKPTASEEQLASGIEALGRAVGVKGQVRRQPKPQAKPAPAVAQPEPAVQPAPAAQPTPPPLPVRPTPEPSSTAWMSWTQEKTENGGFIKNALGYVIVVNKGNFKVYNPAKALIGIYEDEESAKRRVLKDMPRR